VKVYRIVSKKHGIFNVLLDDTDFEVLKNLGGKWGICKMRDSFYVQKRFPDNKVKQLHRFLLNAKSGDYVDHINGNPLDNRRDNLRICSNSANLRNGNLRINNTSGYKGVSWDKSRKKWATVIKVKYKSIHLGRYISFEDAVKARKEAEAKYWSI